MRRHAKEPVVGTAETDVRPNWTMRMPWLLFPLRATERVPDHV